MDIFNETSCQIPPIWKTTYKDFKCNMSIMQCPSGRKLFNCQELKRIRFDNSYILLEDYNPNYIKTMEKSALSEQISKL